MFSLGCIIFELITGKILMEELLARLELTIRDFNDEIKNLCDELIKKEKDLLFH